MEEMLINERFKSPDKVFEKVYGIFDKRDYFNVKGLAQVQIRNFENFLKKGDKNAQALLDKYKGDNKKAHEYIIQVIHDKKKEQAFENFKAFKTAVNKLELVSKGKSKEAYGASDLVKSRIHNNSQKYTIALYSAIRGKKFNNKKDVHTDVDDLLAKNEGFSSDAQRKAAFANGYEEKGKKKNESVNEASMDWEKNFKWANDKELKVISKFIFMNDKGIDGVIKMSKHKPFDFRRTIQKMAKKGLHEGNKRYYQQDRVGSAKYTISYHDGKKKHKDGSDFFDIQTFKNKKDLAKFVNTLHKGGYVYGFNESVNEASIKGRNNKTGEAFGMVIGSDKKNREGNFEVTIRKTYSSRISAYGFVFDKDSNLISVKDYGYSMDGKFPDMKGSSSVSSVRPNKRETITQIAKITSPAFAKKIYQHVNKVNESVNEILVIVDKFDKRKQDYGKVYWKDGGRGPGDGDINKGKKEFAKLSKKHKDLTLVSVGRNSKMYDVMDESVNEASKLAMGIAGFTGTRGIAVDDFIEKNKIDAKKLFNFVKKGNLKDRMAFVSAIAGKPNNKMFKMITKQFSEGNEDGVPQGYNPMVEDKSEIKVLLKKVGKNETKFYDVLTAMEKKYGKNKYRIWLEKSLKDFGVNPKHYDYRTNAAAEEKLYQLGK